MAGQGTRLCETLLTDVASEGANVCVAKIVNDQARAFFKHLRAVVVLAKEVDVRIAFSFQPQLAASV